MDSDLLRFGDETASFRLVLLHGWGADFHDLVPLGEELIHSVDQRLELVALRAPELHPDNVGRQWYKLFPADWASVPLAIENLKSRLKALETKEISLSKTIVLGFSQGGAMALGACCEMPVGGIIACSSYPHPGWRPPSHRPKIFMTHGTMDEIVPFSASEALFNDLNKQNIFVELFAFNGGHEIPIEASSRISLTLKAWLN